MAAERLQDIVKEIAEAAYENARVWALEGGCFSTWNETEQQERALKDAEELVKRIRDATE